MVEGRGSGSKLSAVKKTGFHKACNGVWVQLQKADTKKIKQILEQVNKIT